MIRAFGVAGLPRIGEGDDVAALVVEALTRQGEALADGDVVVVSSKVVSKAAGLVRRGAVREDVVEEQTVRVVAVRTSPRGVTRIVQAPCGVVLAAAGVDASNTEPGTVLVLPADPDRAADELRRRFTALTGARVGVVVSDTAGRPWREGQTDFALGAAGIEVIEDFRGTVDPYGNPLEVTQRAVADEVAALADLVKGKVDGVPAAVVRGLGAFVREGAGAGARALLRGGDGDWFACGHVEAVRAAIGVPAADVPAPPLAGGSIEDRLARALQAATASAHLPVAADMRVEAHGDRATVEVHAPCGATPATYVHLGALVQRIAAAAWAGGLDVEVPPWAAEPGTPPVVVVRARR